MKKTMMSDPYNTSLINSFNASGYFCHLLITISNTYFISPGSGSKLFATPIVFLKVSFLKVMSEKKSAEDNKSKKSYPRSPDKSV